MMICRRNSPIGAKEPVLFFLSCKMEGVFVWRKKARAFVCADRADSPQKENAGIATFIARSAKTALETASR